MVGKKRSIVWKVSKDDFSKIVMESLSYSDVLKKLGLPSSTGGNYKTLKKRIKNDDLDTSHIEAEKKKFRGNPNIRPLNEVLVKGKSEKGSALKKRLVDSNLLDNKCSKCGLEGEWNGEKLSLQLDHVNGDHTDNRLENLRILCPNCHSQTKTYGGRNTKEYIESNFCSCGAKKWKTAKVCSKCVCITKPTKPTKIRWPSNQELEQMLSSMSRVNVAKQLGVSETAVRKHIKKHNLSVVK